MLGSNISLLGLNWFPNIYLALVLASVVTLNNFIFTNGVSPNELEIKTLPE